MCSFYQGNSRHMKPESILSRSEALRDSTKWKRLWESYFGTLHFISDFKPMTAATSGGLPGTAA